ncbi:DPH4 homolog [Papaver somniferum]|uniref:DPH4 homolog n=1 Tax=Papaver somniferum TaxID=3469 RepID=UPI000E6F532E|nr:DPH4 homolog [Papaver somniferum]
MLLDGKRSVLKTHYDILSVKEDADYEEIHANYKRAALKSHPDKTRATTEASEIQHESLETFLVVQKAWEILSDSKTRGIYDRELRDSRRDTETAEDVSLEEMMVEEAGEVLELFYECRCGDYFSIDSVELGEMGYSLGRDESKIFIRRRDSIPATVILPCGSCSLKIRLTITTGS